jgi:predicted P-loop ATPase/GTPase
MKLKTAARIDFAINIILKIIVAPFDLVKSIVDMTLNFFILKPIVSFDRWLSNQLLLHSDEVKDGTICNPDALKMGAHSVYILFKEEQKKEKEEKENK